MVAEILLSFALGGILLIATSYIGTTMALRGFFDGESNVLRNRSSSKSESGSSKETDEDS